MGFNPYEQPRTMRRRRHGWRRIWRRLFFASLGSTIASIIVDVIVGALLGEGLNEVFWYIVLRGVISLFILASVVLTGITAIGWILSPRPAPEIESLSGGET